MKIKALRLPIAFFYILLLITSLGCIANRDITSPRSSFMIGTPSPVIKTAATVALLEKYPDIQVEQSETLKGFSDGYRWLEQFEYATSLLPKGTLDNITSNDDLLIKFQGQPKKWHTGQYFRTNNSIVINTTPNADHPFSYEYLSEDGYTDEEILYVWLHEMGHAWSFQSGRFVIFTEGGSPTLYGHIGYTSEGRVNTLESFAETFVLYVVMPQYLNDNFPTHYAWFKDEVFGGLEYNIPFDPSSSLLARLSK